VSSTFHQKPPEFAQPPLTCALVNASLRELKGNYPVSLKDKLDDLTKDGEEILFHLE